MSARPAHQHAGAPAVVAPDETATPVVVARQPILDRGEAIIGFEVLYRPMTPTHGIDHPEMASSRVIVRALGDIGLDQLTGDRPAFINVTRDLLLGVRPFPLRPERVVLELLEDQVVDAPLLEVLAELAHAGFTIALDDFRFEPGLECLVELASIVKLDVQALDAAALTDHVARLRGKVQTLIAEKVETREEYAVCRDLGFDAFQGYFFAQPVLVEGRSAPTQGLQSLATLASPALDASFEELERLIVQDAGLSHKLLRLANSAFIPTRHSVGSVHQALSLMGTVAVRRWALLLVVADVGDQPHHLLSLGLQRARLCEVLAGSGSRDDVQRAFTAGLFSILDGLLGMPMPDLLEELPFDERMTSALLAHEGPEGRLLAAVLAFERGAFSECERHGFDLAAVAAAYHQALRWAEETTGRLR